MNQVDFQEESNYAPNTLSYEKGSFFYRTVFKMGLVENANQARVVLIALTILFFALAFIIFPYGSREEVTVDPDLEFSQDPFEPLF